MSHETFIQKVEAILTIHIFTPDFNVNELADHCGMSSRQLLRKIQEAFGISPLALIEKLRMEKAQELVQGGKLSSKEIATRIGYTSSSHFTQKYKKYFGLTPSKDKKAK